MSRRRRRTPPSEKQRSVLDSLYPTLDLHGRTGAEAEIEAERWIRERRRDGESTVRVITGRGMHSVGPAVLPQTIEGLLSRLRRDSVQSFEREPGGGAYRVRLVRPPVVDRPASTAGSSERIHASPELVREATESLSDLGIEPTPILIEAEVRRLVKERSREAD
ncbi:MAG: Smr/MutS family protein [Gemmatimonadota bacterium]